MSEVTITVVGNLAADPEVKELGEGRRVVKIRVIANPWCPRAKETVKRYFDVAIWKKPKQNLILAAASKGSKVMVIGDHRTREYNGSLYEDIAASAVVLCGSPGGSQGRIAGQPIEGVYNQPSTEVPNVFAQDDDIPF